MAAIQIHRPFCYEGSVSPLKVWVDGVQVGSVRTRRTELFKVSDAAHSISVSQGWSKSVPLEINLSDGKTIDLTVRIKWRFPASVIIELIRPSLLFTLIPVKQT
jgi:hypothetical protein